MIFSSCNFNEIRTAWEETNNYHRRRSESLHYDPQQYIQDLVSNQNKKRQCEITISSHYFSHWYTAAFTSLSKSLESPHKNPDPKLDLRIFDGSIGIEFRDYLHGKTYRLDFLNQLRREVNEEYDYMINTTLGSILQIPLIPIDVFQILSLSSISSKLVPLYQLINIALSIIEKEGDKRIDNIRLLGGILHQHTIESVSVEQINFLLSRSNNLLSIPSGWISAILRICIDTPELNIELLLNLWGKNKSSELHFLLIRSENSQDKWNQLLEKILYNNHPSALRLGVAIAACIEPRGKAEIILRDRLISEFSSYPISGDCMKFFQALLNLSPSLEEFSLWVQPIIINQVCQSRLTSINISQRFMLAVSSECKIDLTQLREQLSIFITNRSDYPATIVLGALEAIIKIDDINLSILDSKIWQQCFDE